MGAWEFALSFRLAQKQIASPRAAICLLALSKGSLHAAGAHFGAVDAHSVHVLAFHASHSKPLQVGLHVTCNTPTQDKKEKFKSRPKTQEMCAQQKKSKPTLLEEENRLESKYLFSKEGPNYRFLLEIKVATSNEHWNAIFSAKQDPELGWYEKDASQTLKFLEIIPHRESETVFLPGAGTSVLVDELLARGYNLILNDISDEALNKLKTRIGSNDRVTWLHHDISKPLPNGLPSTDIWIDRAVLHFLLEEEAIKGYFTNLHSSLRNGGHALLAEFSSIGAPKCAGLNLHRYSIEEMNMRMGPHFQLLSHEDYIFTNPSGAPRPYIYSLYRKDFE
jgi:hypothetical protein